MRLGRGTEGGGRRALDEHGGVYDPQPLGAGGQRQRGDGRRVEQVGSDHQPPAVPPVGERPGERPQQQDRQVLHRQGQAGGGDGAGEAVHVGGDGDDQQPRAEGGRGAGQPQQAEVRDAENLDHILRR
ncbi:hypothetical protein GCM10022248_57790 [Nonomuraea soli]